MDKMKNIKFGLKLWSINYNCLKKAEELIKRNVFDYIELMVVPDTEISPFQKIKVPYIIHITSERWGVNIGDKAKEEFNLKAINQSIQWADKLSAKYLILHPGFGDFKTTKEFLKKIKDSRILIENMPKLGINNEKMIGFTGFTPKQIKELMTDKFSFCLDFGHAIKVAVSFKKDYKEYIKDFLKLNPKIFHISDGSLDNEKDEHLNIGEGEYNFKFLINCIRENPESMVTLETPRFNKNSLEEDLENIKKLCQGNL